MIDITGVDLVKLAQKAYELSFPKGFGFLHYKNEPLSDEEAKSLVGREERYPLDMNYVHGRSIKLRVRNENGKLLINDSWYDHTDEDLKELLFSVGVQANPKGKHRVSCECSTCLSMKDKT